VVLYFSTGLNIQNCTFTQCPEPVPGASARSQCPERSTTVLIDLHHNLSNKTSGLMWYFNSSKVICILLTYVNALILLLFIICYGKVNYFIILPPFFKPSFTKIVPYIIKITWFKKRKFAKALAKSRYDVFDLTQYLVVL
jgi:hypothetical protein